MTSVKPRPSAAPAREGPSEFDILRQNHRFLREDQSETTTEGQDTWGDALSRKFYSNLWKEYAICDLKHYKSGNFSLRWRTEDEVVSGAGESFCGNTRCKYHEPVNPIPPSSSHYGRGNSKSKHRKQTTPLLRTLELPFGYVEQGEVKSALVKVVLCEKCVKKIMWKREQVKRSAAEQPGEVNSGQDRREVSPLGVSEDEEQSNLQEVGKQTKSTLLSEQDGRRRRRSRSLSPHRKSRKDGPKD